MIEQDITPVIADDEDSVIWQFKRGYTKGLVMPQNWHGDFLESLTQVNLSRDHIDLAREVLYDNEHTGLEAQLKAVYDAYGQLELQVIYRRELLKLLRPFEAKMKRVAAE